MSCYQIYYKDGHKYARPVTSREEYLKLRNSQSQLENLKKARQGDERAKRALIQMNYSCLPNDDGSLKGAKRMSNTVGADLDGKKPEELDAVAEKILAKKDELGLLMLEKSARLHGFHFVFKRHPEMSQVANLMWAGKVIGEELDPAAKDITRVFFTTGGEKDDLLFLDDEIFGPSQPFPMGKGLQTGGSQELRDLDKVDKPDGKPGHSQDAYPQNYLLPSPIGEGPGGEAAGAVSYASIVHALEKSHGGVPAHGSRNQFIFTMACDLRYICDHDPNWVAQVLPTYGEAREKWMNTIRSACSRSMNKSMPKDLKFIIERLKAKQAENAQDCEQEDVVGYDGSGNGTLPPPHPKNIPQPMKDICAPIPEIYKSAVWHAIFASLGAHLWHTYFRYLDNVLHEATFMNVLMAGTGAGKSCIVGPIDAIMKDIRERDSVSMEKEQAWKDEMNTKGSNKDKKKRPEGIIIQEVDPDMTNAAFVMRLSESEGHFLYARMNEIEQFDGLKTSARNNSQFQIMCLAFDPGNTYGQTRVGTQSVSKRVCIRFNWNASTTIHKGQQYFKNVLTDGPISRINFCTIPEQAIGSDMPVYGDFGQEYEAKIKPYIDRLNAARGVVECPEALRLAKKLMKENADFARLSQSRTFENLSYRANVIAYLKAMVLYIMNGYKWEKSIENFVRWSLQYDMWCKMHFFGEAIDKQNGEAEPTKRGPRNLLEQLPDRFTLEEAIDVRRKANLSSNKTMRMLYTWKHRGYIMEEGKGVWKKKSTPEHPAA